MVIKNETDKLRLAKRTKLIYHSYLSKVLIFEINVAVYQKQQMDMYAQVSIYQHSFD